MNDLFSVDEMALRYFYLSLHDFFFEEATLSRFNNLDIYLRTIDVVDPFDDTVNAESELWTTVLEVLLVLFCGDRGFTGLAHSS